MRTFVYFAVSTAFLISCACVRAEGVRPVVIWHGLGDTYDSPGVKRTEEVIKEVHGDVFVYPIRLSNSSSEDRSSSMFGNATEQVSHE